METFIQVLKVLLLMSQIVLGASVIVLIAMIGTMLSDELKEHRSERRAELARTSFDDSFLADLVAEARKRGATRGRHRFDASQQTYYSPGYLERSAEITRANVLPADDSVFAALLKEQREVAPLWS
jgi:hypothetical protein